MKPLQAASCIAMSMVLACCQGRAASVEAAGQPATEAVQAPQIPTERTVYYDGEYDASHSFIVISKVNLSLSVYAPSGLGDTLLIARYPVCLSLKKGQKQRSGDMRTPESEPGKPFSISQIQPASTWHHDFGDGRGMIRAYGDWFLRLVTPGHRGIGIHGSTNNEASVPGRASEGCIRMRDADIVHLKEHYARVGMPVIIKTEDQGNLPFEDRASHIP